MDRRGFITGVLGWGGLAGALAGCDRIAPLVSDGLASLRGELRALRVDHDLCIGCRLCEDACHAVNSSDGDEAAPPARSLIHVHAFVPGPYHVAWACLGCPDRPCVRACDYYADPWAHRRALDIDPETGAVRLDRESCAGCERCLEACRREGGDVLRWDETAYVTGACHLCGGSPACAAACPMDAISVVAVEPGEPLERRSPEEAARGGLERLHARGLGVEPLREADASLGALEVDYDLCTGCRLCEAACDEANGRRLVDGVELAGPGDVTRALIHVHPFPRHYSIPWACLGCPDLPCVAACRAEAFGEPAGRALHLDPESGAVRLAADFCRACRECIAACEERGGAVLRLSDEGLPTGACHLCGGDPECVRACPMEAIRFVAVDRSRNPEVRSPEEAARRGTERCFGEGGRGHGEAGT